MNKPAAKTERQKPQVRVPPVKQAAPPPPVKVDPPRQDIKKSLEYNSSFHNPPPPEEDEVKKPVNQIKEEKKMTISPFGIQQSITKTIPGNTLKKAKK
jgi:hypothetical protein